MLDVDLDLNGDLIWPWREELTKCCLPVPSHTSIDVLSLANMGHRPRPRPHRPLSLPSPSPTSSRRAPAITRFSATTLDLGGRVGRSISASMAGPMLRGVNCRCLKTLLVCGWTYQKGEIPQHCPMICFPHTNRDFTAILPETDNTNKF